MQVLVFFSEENICESCHATILPSGGVFYVVVSKYFNVLLHLEALHCWCLHHAYVSDMAKPFSVVVFHCRHMFHKECLPSTGTVRNFPTVCQHHNLFDLTLSCTWIISLSALSYLRIPDMTILRLLYLFPLSRFRFLACSFVTSAVRRGADQEVESWKWKSNVDLCTHSAITDAFISPPRCFPFTVSALINEYHFPPVTERYMSKNTKHLYWIVSVYLRLTTVKCCSCSACHYCDLVMKCLQSVKNKIKAACGLCLIIMHICSITHLKSSQSIKNVLEELV